MNRVIFTLLLLVGLVSAAYAYRSAVSASGHGFGSSQSEAIQNALRAAKDNARCSVGRLESIVVTDTQCDGWNPYGGQYSCTVEISAECTNE
jgi:hypothetical protein